MAAADLVLPLDHKVRHTGNALHLRPFQLLAHRVTVLVAAEHLLHLALVQARTHRRLGQNVMARDVLLLLKIIREQLLHEPRLHAVQIRVARLRLALALLVRVLDQPVRVPGAPGLAAEFKLDTHRLANRRQAGMDRLGLLFAEPRIEILDLVNRLAALEPRLQLVGQPARGEGVGRVCLKVGLDGAGEALVPDVAPRTDGVWYKLVRVRSS